MCGSRRRSSVPKKIDEVDHPDQGEPEVDVPLGLGVLAALGDAEHIARGGEHDEQLVAPEQERSRAPGRRTARAAGALHDVERGAEQRVAAEGEDRGRGVDRAQPAEGRVLEAEVEDREGELEGDEGAHREARPRPRRAWRCVNRRITSSSYCTPDRAGVPLTATAAISLLSPIARDARTEPRLCAAAIVGARSRSFDLDQTQGFFLQ